MNSLRAKVALLLALLMLALTAMAGYQAYRTRLELVHSAKERVSTTARVAAQDQNNSATYRVQRALSVLSESPDIHRFAGDPGCPKRLAAALKTEPYFANIVIIAPNGDVACAAIPATGVMNVADRDYFSAALTGREPVIGEPVIGRNASQTPFFKERKAQGGTGTAELVGFDGVPRIYGLAPFARTLAGQTYLWVGVSMGPSSAPPTASSSGHWRAGGLLLGAMFGAAWTGADKLVLRRVGAISVAAERLGKGDARARTGISPR